MSLELDIRVPREEFDVEVTTATSTALALTGSSGAGKSTVLRSIAGLEPAAEGEIRVGGAIWLDSSASLPPTMRAVGYLAQRDALFPHLSARDNVAFGLRADGVRASARNRRAMELLDALGVADCGANHAQQLSGGQRRRVALARALAPERGIYLLDEPFAGLDEYASAVAAVLIAQRLSEVGASALIAVHDLQQVVAICPRAIRLERGRVAETVSVAAAAPRARGSARVRQSIGGRQLDCQEGSR